jgi:hypothetical protein
MSRLLNDLDTSLIAYMGCLHKSTVLELEDKLIACQQFQTAVEKSSDFLQTVVSRIGLSGVSDHADIASAMYTVRTDYAGHSQI